MKAQEALQDEDWSVRYAALLKMRRHQDRQDEKPLATLHRLLFDEEEIVRIEALEILAEMPGDHLSEQVKAVILEKRNTRARELFVGCIVNLAIGILLGGLLF